MAQLIVRGLEQDVKTRLQMRAARHGHSMEAEARDILRHALIGEDHAKEGLAERIARRFKGIGLTAEEEIEQIPGGDVTNPFDE